MFNSKYTFTYDIAAPFTKNFFDAEFIVNGQFSHEYYLLYIY